MKAGSAESPTELLTSVTPCILKTLIQFGYIMASLNAVLLFVIIVLASMILATDLFHGVAEAKRPMPSPPYCEPGSGYGSRVSTNNCPRAPTQDMYQGTAVSAQDSLRPHKPASFNAKANDLHAPAPPKVTMKGKRGKKKSEHVPPPPPTAGEA